jgi:hypothetical protein
MKKLLLTLALACMIGVVAHSQNAKTPPASTTPPATAPTTAPADQPNPNAGEFKFVEESHDFGDIPQGTPVTTQFSFTNTGKEPLIIKNCQASCGCTVPSWPKEPILPGKESTIQVTYNAAHAGTFTKSITITSNAQTPTKVIYIKGNVQAKPADQTTPDKQPNMIQNTTTPNK